MRTRQLILKYLTTLYNIGSIQKGLTAVLIMRAVRDGKLFLTDTLARFYPYIPGAANITIQQMLQMASGLKLSENPQGLEDAADSDWDAACCLIWNPRYSNTVPSTTIY